MDSELKKKNTTSKSSKKNTTSKSSKKNSKESSEKAIKNSKELSEEIIKKYEFLKITDDREVKSKEVKYFLDLLDTLNNEQKIQLQALLKGLSND